MLKKVFGYERPNNVNISSKAKLEMILLLLNYKQDKNYQNNKP